MIIPDLSVLLYAIDATSLRHDIARTWLKTTLNDGSDDVGVPLVVHLGFLRLSTSPRLFPNPLPVDKACEWMENLWKNPLVVPVNPGRGHNGILKHLLLALGTGGNLVTDAHLATLALEYDAVLATGDRDFQRFPGLKVHLLF